jgi:hypothetical protein
MRRGGHVGSNPVAHIEDISRYEDEESNYQIFKINIDGTGLTQLTHGSYNNLDPCWLPDGGIAFISDRKPAYAYCYVVTSPVLYRMESDGSKQKRLSANYLMDFTPSVLERRSDHLHPLGVCRPGGVPDPEPLGDQPRRHRKWPGFYGNRVISPGTFMDAQPIPAPAR